MAHNQLPEGLPGIRGPMGNESMVVCGGGGCECYSERCGSPSLFF